MAKSEQKQSPSGKEDLLSLLLRKQQGQKKRDRKEERRGRHKRSRNWFRRVNNVKKGESMPGGEKREVGSLRKRRKFVCSWPCIFLSLSLSRSLKATHAGRSVGRQQRREERAQTWSIADERMFWSSKLYYEDATAVRVERFTWQQGEVMNGWRRGG